MTRRFFIRIAILILFISCKSSQLNSGPHLFKVLGTWERKGDASAGDRIYVQEQFPGGPVIGILIKISNHSKMFNYKIGEIKWKFSGLYRDKNLLLNNLNSKVITEEFSRRILKIEKQYSLFTATIPKKGIIKLETCDKEPIHRIGNTQVWYHIK